MFQKVEHKIIEILKLLNIRIQSISKKKKIYMLGIPLHGNLGDQAIVYAEREFLKDYFGEYKIIEIESDLVVSQINTLKKIIKSNPILVHGGGFLGSIWPKEEKMFETTIMNFLENLIIVMPQTIYFSNDEEGKVAFEKAKKIYEMHNHLLILCRERYSYEFMQQKFPKCQILLTLDMVLYLKQYISKKQKKNVALFCIRRDKEKIHYNLENVEDFVLGKQLKIKYTDTVIDKRIHSFQRKKFLYRKLEEFSNSSLVITDRLHGMVFALICKTPCVVLENNNYKIKGVYEWIKDINYIKLSSEKSINENINEVIDLIPIDNRKNLNDMFEEMARIIKERIKQGEKNK